MSNDNEHFDRIIDNVLLDEQTKNDQFLAESPEFEASHIANIIEKLIHLSRFGNLLTLIVGNNGSGKTWLIDKFIAATDDSSLICHIKSHPLLSIDQLFQQVTESFAGESTFSGIPLTANQYEEWADQLTSFPGNRILVIDDAEVLSTSVLHELCQLSAMQQDKETPHLHLILVGNYDLNNILEQASQSILDEDGIYAIDIPSLSDEEACEWLDYLFLDAGVIFLPEEDVLEDMLTNGQGNLALLKELAVEYSTEHNDIKELEDEPEPWRVSVVGYWFASLTVIIMMVLGLFFYQDELIELTGFGDNNKEQLIPKEQETLYVSGEIASSTDNEIIVSDTSDEKMPVAEPVEPVEADPLVPDRNIANILESEQEPDTTAQALENFNSEIQQTEGISSENKEITKTDLTDIPLIKQSTLSAAEETLMSRDDSDYAVQIIGVSKEVTATSFIQKYSLPKMTYYRRSLNGKELFTVILAGFQNKADANKARTELSDELQKNGPWIKRLSIIKGEILEAHNLIKD